MVKPRMRTRGTVAIRIPLPLVRRRRVCRMGMGMVARPIRATTKPERLGLDATWKGGGRIALGQVSRRWILGWTGILVPVDD